MQGYKKIVQIIRVDVEICQYLYLLLKSTGASTIVIPLPHQSAGL